MSWPSCGMSPRNIQLNPLSPWHKGRSCFLVHPCREDSTRSSLIKVLMMMMTNMSDHTNLQKPREDDKSPFLLKCYRASNNPDADSFGALRLDWENNEGRLHWRHLTISEQRNVLEFEVSLSMKILVANCVGDWAGSQPLKGKLGNFFLSLQSFHWS